MTDIAELERRIRAALDRIGQEIEALNGDADDDLAATLAAERMARADLETRVGELEAELRKVSAREDTAERLQAAVEAAADESLRLRQVNDALRASNRALREASAGGVAEAGLIDRSMKAELEALRTARDADRAELDAILATLEPLIGGRAHA